MSGRESNAAAYLEYARLMNGSCPTCGTIYGALGFPRCDCDASTTATPPPPESGSEGSCSGVSG